MDQGVVVRVYRRMLRVAFPGSLTAQDEAEIVGIFEDGLRHARTRGRLRALRYAGVALAAAVKDGMVERLDGAHHVVTGLGSDVRLALRRALSRPLFTVVATLSLTIGIGLSAFLFNAVDALLLTPLPVPAPDEIVRVFDPGASTRLRGQLPLAAVEVLDREARSLVAVAGFQRRRVGVRVGEELRVAAAEAVTPSYFRVVDVNALAGRLLEPGDTASGAPPVALVSAGWVESLPAEAGTPLGGTVEVNGRPHSVVGILSEPFRGSHFAAPTDLWLPLSAGSASMVESAGSGPTGASTGPSPVRVEALARLRTGATPSGATEEVRRLLASAELGSVVTREQADGYFVLPEREGLINPAMPHLVDVGAGIALTGFLILLLVACANTGGMLLARTAARTDEIAVRAALGATGTRIARQLVVETLILVIPGTGLAVLVASWAEPAFTRLIPALANLSLDFSLDTRLLAFVAALALVSTLIATFLPFRAAVRHAESGGVRAGRGEVGDDARSMEGVVILQVAVAVVVLLVGGLALRTHRWYQDADPGFVTRDRVAVTVDVGLHGLDPQARDLFYRELLATLERRPELGGVALAQGVTTGGGPVHISRDDGPTLEAASNVVSAGYFDLLGITVRRGRTFGSGVAAATTIVVNRTLATELGGEGSLVGRTLGVSGFGAMEIVGVVEDVKHGSLAAGGRPLAYLSASGRLEDRMTLLAAAAGREVEAISTVRDAIASARPGLPALDATTLDSWVQQDRLLARAGAALGAVAGILTLILVGTGIWGSVAFGVRSRRGEWGVRLALGAEPRRLFGQVLLGGMRLAGWGVILGLPVGLGLAALGRGLFVGVAVLDGPTLASVLALVVTGVFVALLGPARASATVDPAQALRSE